MRDVFGKYKAACVLLRIGRSTLGDATPAILFFDVVVAIHVMCVIIAFGVTFAYPLSPPVAQVQHTRGDADGPRDAGAGSASG